MPISIFKILIDWLYNSLVVSISKSLRTTLNFFDFKKERPALLIGTTESVTAFGD